VLPTPMDLEDRFDSRPDDLPQDMDIDGVLTEYVEAFLPNRLRNMVHTAAFIMASPDLSFLRQKGREKPEVPEVAAAAQAEKDGEPVPEVKLVDTESDPTSGGGSPGSTA